MKDIESLMSTLNSLKNKYMNSTNSNDKLRSKQLYEMFIKDLVKIDPKYLEYYKNDLKDLDITLTMKTNSTKDEIKKETSKKEVIDTKEDKYIIKLKEDINNINTLSFITWLNNYKEYIKTKSDRNELNNKVSDILSSKEIDPKYKKMFLNAMTDKKEIVNADKKSIKNERNIKDIPLDIVRVKKTFNTKVQNMVEEFNMNKLLKEHNLSIKNNKIVDNLGKILFGKGIAGILYKVIKNKVLNNNLEGKIDKNYKKNRYLSMLLRMKNKFEYKNKFSDYDGLSESEENNLIQKGMGKVK